ncbi:MAG TPA: (d)CMP kinase, partial [Cytophagales bacterium]|nr:(d)CMP kinase [Cytophagales bacterium]
MYRAVTLYFIQNYITFTNPKEVQKALEKIDIDFVHNEKLNHSETFLNNINVESEIRKMYISEKVSPVSAIKEVRAFLVAQQQKLGRKGGVVMDGRDIGTTVFPNAELKLFFTADFNVRAQRRQQELLEKKQLVEFDEILQNLRHRDEIDTTRKESPLMKAPDAYVLDTTYLAFEEQVNYVVHLAQEAIRRKEEQVGLTNKTQI